MKIHNENYSKWGKKLFHLYSERTAQYSANSIFTKYDINKRGEKKPWSMDWLTIYKRTHNSIDNLKSFSSSIEPIQQILNFWSTVSPINVRSIAYVQKWKLPMTKTMQCIMGSDYDVHVLFSFELLWKLIFSSYSAEALDAIIVTLEGVFYGHWLCAPDLKFNIQYPNAFGRQSQRQRQS